MNFGKEAKQIISTVAPVLISATAGPFAPLALGILHTLMGTGGDASKLDAAIASASPDILLKLKQAGMDFQVRMKELGISEQKLMYEDVASARHMEALTRDPTARRLAWLIIGGFLVTSLAQLVAMMGWAEQVNKIPAQGWLLVGNISGYLANEAKQAAAFYFGSSASGQAKDAALAEIAKQP